VFKVYFESIDGGYVWEYASKLRAYERYLSCRNCYADAYVALIAPDGTTLKERA
jgi:hypothetical protein